MKMGFIKKSISLNLLSLFGYICLLTILYTEIEAAYFFHTRFYGHSFIRFVVRWYYPFLFQLGLIVLAIIEFILYKYEKLPQINTSKIPVALIKWYSYLFWVGILLVFSPVYLAILIFA
jgi:hypothetical protein